MCVCVCVWGSILKLHASLAVHVALKIQDCTNYNLASEGCESHSVVSNSLQLHGLYSLWNSPGQNTGVGSYYLLQGIFPTQRSNPGLPHCGWILYQLSHKEANTGVSSLSLLQGNLPGPGIEPGSPALQVNSLTTEHIREALCNLVVLGK